MMCCAFKLLSNLFLSGKYLRMKGWVTQYVFLYSGIKEVILFEGCETAANDFPWNFDVTREGKNDVVQKNWSGNQIRSIDIPNLANQTQSNSLWNSIVPKGWNLNAKKIPFFCYAYRTLMLHVRSCVCYTDVHKDLYRQRYWGS